MASEERPISLEYKEILEQLGSAEPTTERQAHAVLQCIRVANGYLDKETLQDVHEMRRHTSTQPVLHLAEQYRQTQAAYTKAISEKLYSSKYHFLYELIQNADDTKYSNVVSSSTVPYIRFTATPSTLLIETNEDGFRRADVESICATGKSSKKATASDMHIGEKGFGFKSVFSVACDVLVQSGIWAFRFKHAPEDDGLGMVTPLEAAREILPPDVVTRITLIFSDATAEGHQRICRELARMPDTTILHLRKLESIQVVINQSSKTAVQKYPPRVGELGKTVHIKKFTTSDGVESTDERKFITTTYNINPMPKDASRKNRTKADVDLSFPIDAQTNLPRLSAEGHHVFAYLPLKDPLPIQVCAITQCRHGQAQYVRGVLLHRMAHSFIVKGTDQVQFIVQADFITSTSRESVTDSAWNTTLRDGVAQAFCNAIATFATKEHPLRHFWLDYVPRGIMRNSFWDPLYMLIRSKLQEMPVLQTWQGGLFKRPTELRRLSDVCIHEGSPIFRDLQNEIYSASEYRNRHLELLKDLGLPLVHWDEIISRMEADLVKLDSRVKSYAPNHSWHRACAQLISKALKIEQATMDSCRKRIKRLSIIPVNNGRSWTGAPDANPGGKRKIYFPTTEGIEIPSSIGLHLVDPPAASVPERRALFRMLGVQECSKDEVVRQIEAAHRRNRTLAHRDLCAEFRYLFRFNPNAEPLRPYVLEESGAYITTSAPLYFLSDAEYDTQNLLPNSFRNEPQSEVAYFIHHSLFKTEEQWTYFHGRFWKDWLQTVTGARYHPPLLHSPKPLSGEHSISKTILAVLQHSPGKFVGMLKAHWNEYKADVHWVHKELQGLKVPCNDGRLVELHKCYLPTPEILAKLRVLGTERCIPLLQLPAAWDNESRKEWDFLGKLGVRSQIDLHFYLEIYKKLVEGDDKPLYKDLSNAKDIFITLYTDMAGLATPSDCDYLRRELAQIVVFSFGVFPNTTELHNCVWDGPDFLTIKHPLKKHYGHVALLKTFFKVFLETPDCTVDDIFSELAFRSSRNIKFGWDAIYRYLDNNILSERHWQRIRDEFASRNLVQGSDGTMYALRNCLWRSPFPLSGFIEVSLVYPNLENFFVKRLGVEKANPAMLIEEIKKLAKGSSPQIENIRQRLLGISRLLLKSGINDAVAKALTGLAKVKFLPQITRDGGKVLVGKDDDFVINDHQRFGDAFESQYILLDFSVEEVHVLNTVFDYMGFGVRYLSRAVKEASAVGEDAVEDESLTSAFRSRAYALYCCAAHYKSTIALRDDIALFDHLSKARILIADSITTDLVLTFKDREVRVHSDRLALHHELVSGQFKFYVPKDERLRNSCYRAQLPRLLANIMKIASNETQAISQILSHELWELDDILFEQDISAVGWIAKPTYEVPSSVLASADREQHSARESPGALLEHHVGVPGQPEREVSTALSSGTTRFTPPIIESLRERSHVFDTPPVTSTPQPPRYERLIEEVVQSAHRAREQQQHFSSSPLRPHISTPTHNQPAFEYNHEETFGNRDTNEVAHDIRIGASGESYVYEILSGLNLPGFSIDNWRSRIRGELRIHSRYAAVTNWQGRETADFVYTDRDGSLTQYLAENCSGGMPERVLDARPQGMAPKPIEYYLEVKTTTSRCDTRFYMSGSQYQRMENYAIPATGSFDKVYVILRVYNLGQNTGMRIFVDPHRLRGSHIDFEIATYHCKTKTAV